ncbi:MAG: NAD(P)/FAD-dependent oxidoreductase [archaeon]|nr:NAD(P)/FAD-dependent oxidoreductase [archaeon]
MNSLVGSLRRGSGWAGKYIGAEAGDVDKSQVARAVERSKKGGGDRRRVVVVGGGHNGLVAAAYLAGAGMEVTVLERRRTVGGACVTEEIVPGFKFSRGAYLAGLLRPGVVDELQLTRHGFSYLPRDPSSFTPTPERGGESLLMGGGDEATLRAIARLNAADAEAYPRYEGLLGAARDLVAPLLDCAPPQWDARARMPERVHTLRTLGGAAAQAVRHSKRLPELWELLTAPAAALLDRYFANDLLKATLATDAVIGANTAPSQPGSAYVLLHHVMGHCGDPSRGGVWSQVPGGMGTVTQAIAAAARERGAVIVTGAPVQRILESGGAVRGVQLADGSVVEADTVLSGTTPYHTFLELLPGENSSLPASFVEHVRASDYSGGALKINCAVDRLPDFLCLPNSPHSSSPGPQHRGTVHFEGSIAEIEAAHREASSGRPASRPVIEMTIPSVIDPSLAPAGKHVVQLFVQYAPYDLDPKVGSWADPSFTNAYADRIFRIVDEFAPGFSSSVIARDVLTPYHLERVFGLHKGNIQHGGIALHQIAWARPVPGFSSYRTPLKGLYMCAAGTHPGGGVQGAPGRNCARVVISDLLGKFMK